MQDILSVLYPWIKSLHIIAVISWMAGLFYLPRLFVHHKESVDRKSSADALFQTMEEKLLRVIMNPAMIITWICGVLLASTAGVVDWTALWPWMKFISVLGMTVFHMWLGGQRKKFASQTEQLTGKQYRLMNEVPTALLIVIVISVVARPF